MKWMLGKMKEKRKAKKLAQRTLIPQIGSRHNNKRIRPAAFEELNQSINSLHNKEAAGKFQNMTRWMGMKLLNTIKDDC